MTTHPTRDHPPIADPSTQFPEWVVSLTRCRTEREALWRSLTHEPGLDFDLKWQHDADDAIVPGNCQEQLQALAIPEKAEIFPSGIRHPAVPCGFLSVTDNRPLLLPKAICSLEFPQAFELLASNAGRKRRIPMVLHFVGCIRLKTNSDDGKLTEHFWSRRLLSQRCRHPENGFRNIG